MVHGACGVVSSRSKAFASTWRSRHTATDSDTSSRISPINLDEEIALAVVLQATSQWFLEVVGPWLGQHYLQPRMTDCMSYI